MKVDEFLESVLKEKDESKRDELVENKFNEIEKEIEKCERKLNSLNDFREALAQFHVMLRRM
jgi:hypothetical protein